MTKGKTRVLEVVFGLQLGGIEAFLYNHFQHMDLDRFEFELLSFMPKVPACEERFLRMGILHHQPAMCAKNDAGVRRCVRAFLHENRFDVVHVHLNEQSAMVLRQAKAAGVPVRIAHSHCVLGPAAPERARREIAAAATHLAACSVPAGNWLFGEAACRAGKVLHLRNAIDIRAFAFNAATRAATRQTLGIKDHFCVGTVGRLCNEKNPLFLLKVFAEIKKARPDAMLLHVGAITDDALAEEFRRQAQTLGLWQSVLLLGAKTEIAPYYQAMDVFLFPSFYEGFSIAALEAQAAGLPTLLSCGASPAAVLTDIAVVVPLAREAAQWAKAVLQLASTPRSDQSAFVAAAGYDIEDSVAMLERLYLYASL